MNRNKGQSEKKEKWKKLRNTMDLNEAKSRELQKKLYLLFHKQILTCFFTFDSELEPSTSAASIAY